MRVYCINGRNLVECSTDRLGVFRFKDLPPGKLQLQLRKDVQRIGIAIIPPEAVEVDLCFPSRVEEQLRDRLILEKRAKGR
jgi:hypothetical protein